MPSENVSAAQVYDIIIVGAGPAGLTAGLYAVRSGRSVVLLEQLASGGQAATTWQVDNYPGVPHVNGAELMKTIDQQVRELGLQILSDPVEGLTPGEIKRVQGAAAVYRGRTVILATGALPRKMEIPGEEEYRGRGVSYCATCDGAFFRDLPVAVIGGGNTALEEAEFLTRFASKVYLIHRRAEFRADKMVQDQVLKNPKIEIVTPFVPYDILGDGKSVTSLAVGPRNSRECRQLSVKGVFFFIGLTPQTAVFRDVLDLDEAGYIRTNQDLETSAGGVFAAGDCRANKVKQIVVAAGEGATAAIMADRHLQLHTP